MKRWLKNYVDSISIEYSDSGTPLTTDRPVFWAPNWPIPEKGTTQLIINSWAALFLPDKKHGIKVIFPQGETCSLNFSLKELVNLIDTTLLSKPELIYLLLLSYDYGVRQLNLALNDFYQLPDWFLLLPAEGFLKMEGSTRVLNFNSSLPELEIHDHQKFNKAPTGTIINEGKENYLQKIRQIRQLIAEGEFYQLNYTIRFSRKLWLNGLKLFRQWHSKTLAPFSFYLQLPDFQLISVSPERFWFQKGHLVQSEPIKGTIKTSTNPEHDASLKNQLARSEKDHAELNMITDLLRNDLSRVCCPGSVKVMEQSELRSFKYVHHLVSTIQGKLQPGKIFFDLIEATFPGGSITGCPKIAAMQYINQLENHNRSFYTGSLFLRFPGNNLTDANILIRTVILKDNWLHYQAGGGIVIDSNPETEYLECLAKAAPILNG